MPKPFELMVKELAKIADAYQKSDSADERKDLLQTMRLVLDEIDSLHAIYSSRNLIELYE
jgi:hypothetical protein